MVKPFLHLLLAFCIALASPGAEAADKKKGAKSKTTAKRATKPKPAPEPAPPPLAPGELPLAAKSAILIDAKSGEVIYEKNADELQYPASATKILTALLVIEAGDLEKEVVVELSDTKVEPSSLAFKPGERFTRLNLLYALLLKSANDASIALGRDNAGSMEAFLEKMNLRAQQLGALSSHFTNTHGLHNPHHYVTARDMACIARAAMQHPLFRQIVATPNFTFGSGETAVKVRNHNKLLAKLPECTGIKTGYTVRAQQVLVSSASRRGQELISVVLYTNKPGIWEDSKLLLLHGFEKLGLAPDDLPDQGCSFPEFPDQKQN